MWKFLIVLLVIFFKPVGPDPDPRVPVESVSALWLDVSLGRPLVGWFNGLARPNDIARADNPTQLRLLENVTAGRKLLVFKSAAEAERVLPEIAHQIDILGYNLEHNSANPAEEQANPLQSVLRMRSLADEYGLTLAFGPDHEFALSHGVVIAPHVDIFVLQVQRAQTDPASVYKFVRPLIPKLRAANPDLQVTIQVRTEGDIVEVANLIESLKNELDGVSILTSPGTIPEAEALVEELRRRTAETGHFPDSSLVVR